MSGCDRYHDLMKELLGGEITESALRDLRAHAASCSACRGIMDLHGLLLDEGRRVSEPAEAEFLAMRREVGGQVAAGAGGTGRPASWLRWVASPRLRPVAAVSLGAALLAGGFLAGRLTAPPFGFDEDSLVKEIQRQASLGRGLEAYWDSPFVYSNVSFRQLDDGNLALGFDVTRHVDLAVPPQSMMAREVIFQAILDPSATGLRLKAMSLAEESLDTRLKEVLVFTLMNDPSLAVRIRALAILRHHASDPMVQQALLKCLEQDQSVQIRLEALEGLARQGVSSETIRRTIAGGNLASDRAVMQHAVELTGGSY